MSFSMKVEDYDKLEEDIKEETKLNKVEKEKVEDIAKHNIDNLTNLDIDAMKEKYMIAKEIEEFGIQSLRESSEQNHLLQRSIHQLSGEGSNGREVLDGIEILKSQMITLNPEQLEEKRTGIFSKFFSPATTYFDKYKRLDGIIEGIIDSLDVGKEKLKDDNIALEIESVALRDLTKKLAKEIELGITMDTKLSIDLENMIKRGENELNIEFIEQEIVFPLRQRIIDLQQMLVVNRQGILSIEAVRRNNNELMRGVDRAKYVTVSALRIATMVASALYDQKVVLKQINDLNTTTADFIESTSRVLKNQSIEISRQSANATLSLDTLKMAYEETIDALDIMNSYKVEALPKMKEIILEFEKLSNNTRGSIIYKNQD